MKQTLSIKQLACQNLQTRIDRSSRSQIFFKIGVLKNFAKFTRKQPCWSLFLITLQVWKPATLLKGDSNTGVFLWIWRIFKKSCFYRIPLMATSQQTILLVSEMSIFYLTLTCKKIIKQDICILQWCHYYGLLIWYSVTKNECLRAVTK